MATRHEVSRHQHGTMDITEQKKTFVGFIKWSAWAAALSLLSLVFIALLNA